LDINLKILTDLPRIFRECLDIAHNIDFFPGHKKDELLDHMEKIEKSLSELNNLGLTIGDYTELISNVNDINGIVDLILKTEIPFVIDAISDPSTRKPIRIHELLEAEFNNLHLRFKGGLGVFFSSDRNMDSVHEGIIKNLIAETTSFFTEAHGFINNYPTTNYEKFRETLRKISMNLIQISGLCTKHIKRLGNSLTF